MIIYIEYFCFIYYLFAFYKCFLSYTGSDFINILNSSIFYKVLISVKITLKTARLNQSNWIWNIE